jgi:DNA-directed RNA polymerase subunit RPC12/RpoP
MKCLDCSREFIPDKKDLLPARRCSDCRVRILLSYRNERSLYQRKCDLCQRDFIGVYPPDSKYKVYCSKCWWSDQWDPYQYGLAFNAQLPFLEQFYSLYSQVPHLGMNTTDSENSDYCNFADKQKDCYLVVNATQNENLYYCERAFSSKDSLECNGLTNCQLNYWNLSCRDCYHICFSEFCENMTDCWFCSNCKSCQDCFGSFGLRNQKFVYFNQQLTEKKYIKTVETYCNASPQNFDQLKQQVYQHWQKFPHRYANVLLSENVTGDNVTRSKNSVYVFDADEMENCYHCYVGLKAKDSQYCVPADEAEHCYNSMSTWKSYNTNCSNACWYGSDIFYSHNCMNGQHLIGCDGLQKARYCILNKKYQPEEYEKIKTEIIKQLKQDNIYGEYFPASFNPFAYNETIAQEHYPLNKEQAVKLGYKWKEENINKTPDGCIQCGKPFKIIKQEKELYKKIGVPEPQKCPKCRYEERIQRRNPRRLYQRECQHKDCHKKLMSSFSEDRPEIIYCAEHFQQEYN